MKTTLLLLLVSVSLQAQPTLTEKQQQAISLVIDKYTLARDKKDTVLLKTILTTDVDQLVSSGVWRSGIKAAVQGMLQSSESNPGSRKIIIDKIRLLTATSAVADARYEIQNPDGTLRKMWSTFIVINTADTWKISAIRNMLPQK